MGAVRGPLALVAADGAVPVLPGAALLEEMLAGWRRQQQARRLTIRLIGERERVVRQFAAYTGCWPWQWSAAQAEAWVASGGWALAALCDILDCGPGDLVEPAAGGRRAAGPAATTDSGPLPRPVRARVTGAARG